MWHVHRAETPISPLASLLPSLYLRWNWHGWKYARHLLPGCSPDPGLLVAIILFLYCSSLYQGYCLRENKSYLPLGHWSCLGRLQMGSLVQDPLLPQLSLNGVFHWIPLSTPLISKTKKVKTWKTAKWKKNKPEAQNKNRQTDLLQPTYYFAKILLKHHQRLPLLRSTVTKGAKWNMPPPYFPWDCGSTAGNFWILIRCYLIYLIGNLGRKKCPMSKLPSWRDLMNNAV